MLRQRRHWSRQHQSLSSNVGIFVFVNCINALNLPRIAVWSQAWYIVVPLVAVILGHWSLLLHGKNMGSAFVQSAHIAPGILLKAAWIPGQGCVITETNSTLLAATFIYTMSFDFVVLTLTAWKLFQPNSGRSKLVELIFSDGLIYFLIA